ncbi:hypothetical protein GCM10010339_92050 [Streptomyces alanosinicus]|uniref:Uncharacterized protein n=1 Tax=Streptomyces alanosinicus TaxID=68171 RepID=A0A918YVX7_9ACTN|nr:hypothetical protein GCM10010339_92050 [Streptomyces alanosinicus]
MSCGTGPPKALRSVHSAAARAADATYSGAIDSKGKSQEHRIDNLTSATQGNQSGARQS